MNYFSDIKFFPNTWPSALNCKSCSKSQKHFFLREGQNFFENKILMLFILQKLLDALSLKLGREAKQYDINTITDQDLKRKLESLSQIGTSILEQEDLDKYNKITTEMEKIYSKAKVPAFYNESQMLSLDPDITLILAESRDPEELEYYWTHWREVTGKDFQITCLETIGGFGHDAT
jgi:hypothetical protein